MNTPAGPSFLYSCLLDREGGASDIDSASLPDWNPDKGVLWLHLDLLDAVSRRWLEEDSGLDETVVEALLAQETRPRSYLGEKGLLVVLRGVNTNPGEDPGDMVAIRMWIEPHRVISTRRRRLLSVVDMRAALTEGTGPRSSGELLAYLIGRLADRIGDFVNSIEDRVAAAEEGLVDADSTEFRQTITALRRQIATVRRFLAPQRDALDRMYRQPGPWLSSSETHELREESDRITRYLEDLDLARERTLVLREEFLGQLAQEQNARMYVLSVVAAIFLPLTFITGMLGMNVGGLPGLESPQGFAASVLIMVVSAAGLIGYFRWKKWL